MLYLRKCSKPWAKNYDPQCLARVAGNAEGILVVVRSTLDVSWLLDCWTCSHNTSAVVGGVAVLLAQKAHSSRKALDLEGHRCREVANILEKKRKWKYNYVTSNSQTNFLDQSNKQHKLILPEILIIVRTLLTMGRYKNITLVILLTILTFFMVTMPFAFH